MLTAIDFFSGFGGWTRRGKDAGLSVLWAANHWPEAVEWHTRNNPETIHACQDLHQANWANVPKHDVMLASPCCQGHTKARERLPATLSTTTHARLHGRQCRTPRSTGRSLR